MANPEGTEILPEGGNGSRRSRSIRDMMRPDDPLARASRSRRGEDDDEEALKWAALEKLPTYDRLRTTIIENLKGSKKEFVPLNLKDMSRSRNQHLVQKLFQMNPEEDNEKFLARLRARMDRVGIEQPKVEVRWENLSVNAEVQIGSRALPSLYNGLLGAAETVLEKLRIAKRKKTKLNILDDQFGILKPGRMVLLLGPPGGGKTTLLLALAGQLEKELKVTGDITYNGYSLNEFKPRKSAAYISQNDLHEPQLTVRETLQFSARYQGVGHRYDLLTELMKREKELGVYPEPEIDTFMKAVSTSEVAHELNTEYIMKILGLDVCADTAVGNEMIRGISGGQKKRVTTAEMLVGPMRTLFMDEISTGLDSSTTYQIVKCLGQFAHVTDSTIFISLLQPAPETYELFDDVILISDGQLVYNGPREHVLEFMASVGFSCPPRKGVADFLQEVTSRKDQEQYWSDKSTPYTFVPVGKFNEAFKKFHVGKNLLAELKAPYDKSKSHKAALVFDEWSLSKWDMLKVTFDREVTLLKRNSFIYIFKSTQLAITAFATMTTYFRTRMHHRNLADAQKMSAALFFGLTMIMFNGFSEMDMICIRLPVFYKLRRMRFYPAWTFSLATLILRIPFAFIETFIWVAIVYYTVGMAPNAGRFVRQYFLLTLAHIMASSIFRMIGGFARTIVIAYSVGAAGLLLLFALSGFMIPRTRIKHWWIWGYYVSPMSYAMNGISVNEFLAPQWDKPSGLAGDGLALGVRQLKLHGQFTRGYWYWLSVGAMIVSSIILYIFFTLALTYFQSPYSKNVGMSEERLAEKEMNRTGQVVRISSRRKKPSTAVRVVKSLIPRSLATASRSKSQSDGEIGAVTSLSRQASGGNGANTHAAEVIQESLASNEASTSAAAAAAPGDIAANDPINTVGKRGMVLPFQPLAITFNDINYYVDMPAAMRETTGEAEETKLRLLQNITGSFRPGVLTALMGVTGAGKTTLMDVLAGRKTKGIIEGEIRISGYLKDQETFARVAGYCEQNDIHSPQVTVLESLIFSAWLRLSRDIEPEVKEKFVKEVMELVELIPLKNALVGLPGETGLSTEQRKRLTIAVELVANPSIIFMDEPTSGLDARAAAIVMRTVRNTVDTGRTVVCTIHQPSIDNFEAFDELLLLKRGGQVVYSGPLGKDSCLLVEYFESVQGVPRIKSGYNPAAWMLEVTSPGMENTLQVDFAEIYKNSDLSERNKSLVASLSTPASGSKDLHFSEKFSQPFLVQFKWILWKMHWTYWRYSNYNLARLLLVLLTALFFGTMFWRIGHHTGSELNLFAIMGSMYASTVFIGVPFSSLVQPVVATERTVFYRERSAGMYSEVSYALAQMMIELPYNFVAACLYAVITYSMINLDWKADKFFFYLYFLFMTQVFFTYYGIMAVALTPNTTFASVLSAFFYNIWSLLGGFFVLKPDIPPWWKWFYWINPLSYTLYGSIVSQFGDMDDRFLTTTDNHVMTVKHFVQEHFGFKHSFLPFVSLMMLCFVLLFTFVTIFAMKFLNYHSR